MGRHFPKKREKSPGKGGVLKFAEGGMVPAPTDEEMERAKGTIRGLTSLGKGGDWRPRVFTKSSNIAVENAAQSTKELADDIRKRRGDTD